MKGEDASVACDGEPGQCPLVAGVRRLSHPFRSISSNLIRPSLSVAGGAGERVHVDRFMDPEG